MYKFRRRIPSIFETNSAEFLIASPNFSKITSLQSYCLGVLRVFVRALARLKMVCAINIFRIMYIYDRDNSSSLSFQRKFIVYFMSMFS